MKSPNTQDIQYQIYTDGRTGELYARDEVSGEWVYKMSFVYDIDTACRRLESGIPSLLAEVVPSNMEIVKVGNDVEHSFIVCQTIACGTVGDIIDQISELQSKADI